LSWSVTLARLAEEWADACYFNHTDGVLRDEPYGENIVTATGNFPVQSAVATFIQDKNEVLSCWRSNSCQDKKDRYSLPLGACSHRYCCQQRSLKYA